MIAAAFKKFMPTLGSSRYDFKLDGLIHFLEARRGRGKSYTLTALTKHCIKNRIPIVTNSQSINFYKVALQCTAEGTFSNILEALEWCDQNIVFAAHWDDLLKCHDCMVILDEVTRLFEGRAGFAAQRTPQIMYDWIQQSRKVRVTLYMAGQSYGWIDKKVAELVDILWVTRKVENPKARNPDGSLQPLRFYLYGTDPRGAGETHKVKRNAPEFMMVIPFKMEIATLYNSWELINLVTGEPSFKMIQDLKAYFKSIDVIWEPDAKEILQEQIERLRAAPLDQYAEWLQLTYPPDAPQPAEAGGGSGAPALAGVPESLPPQNPEPATMQKITPLEAGVPSNLPAWGAPILADRS